MKEYKFKINGNDYAVEIVEVDGDEATVNVNGHSYTLEVTGITVKPASKTPKVVNAQVSAPSENYDPATEKQHHANASTQLQAVKSPLPGAILDVTVKPGDKVKVGQHLLILEAMKMENNIDSDKEGTVKEVKVRKGDSVLEGDVLITIV